MTQLTLPVPVIHSDVDGIEMGILDDGTPYLSARGLAKLCGVAYSVITGWRHDPNALTGRDAAVRQLLRAQGYSDDAIFVRVEVAGTTINAYPDAVCMAVLAFTSAVRAGCGWPSPPA